jgi:hypothetical protein
MTDNAIEPNPTVRFLRSLDIFMFLLFLLVIGVLLIILTLGLFAEIQYPMPKLLKTQRDRFASTGCPDLAYCYFIATYSFYLY